jgi:hypothetical protein
MNVRRVIEELYSILVTWAWSLSLLVTGYTIFKAILHDGHWWSSVAGMALITGVLYWMRPDVQTKEIERLKKKESRGH